MADTAGQSLVDRLMRVFGLRRKGLVPGPSTDDGSEVLLSDGWHDVDEIGGGGGGGDITAVTAGPGLTGGGTSGAVSLAADFGTGAGEVCEGNDSRLSDARTPTPHATSHKHGGSDEVATATPAANAIPKASAGGKLDSWISDAASGTKGLVQLAGQLGGSATSPDVRGLRETAGPTLLTLGSVPDGYLLKRSGSTLIGVTGSSGGPANEPLGHDVSALPNVVSHWRMLEAILGGTSVPDVLGAHDGTAASTLQAVGRPWFNSEGQVWVNTSITLANSANLLTELLASCYFMAWVWMDHPITTHVWFEFGAAGETLATNNIFQVGIVSALFRAFWESGAGTDHITNFTRLTGGLHHVCIAREHNTGAGTSTVHGWVDGTLIKSTSGVTNPAGGTSSTGFLSSQNDQCYLTDCVLGSGGIPTTPQVLAQAKRGWGIY